MAYIIQNRIKYGGSVPQVAVQDTTPTNPNIEVWYDTSSDAVAEAKDIKYDNSVSGSNQITVQGQLDKLGRVLGIWTVDTWKTTGTATQTVTGSSNYTAFFIVAGGVGMLGLKNDNKIYACGGFPDTSSHITTMLDISVSGDVWTLNKGTFETHTASGSHGTVNVTSITKVIGIF